MENLLKKSPGSGPYGLTEGLTSPQKRESICSFFLRDPQARDPLHGLTEGSVPRLRSMKVSSASSSKQVQTHEKSSEQSRIDILIIRNKIEIPRLGTLWSDRGIDISTEMWKYLQLFLRA